MTRSIHLQFRPDRSAGNDVVLTFGTTEQTEDSYYFALDRNIEPDQHSPEKIVRVMSELLAQWTLRLETREASVFLPVGWSDQSMTWLRCEQRKSGTVELSLGFSEDEGWALSASDIGDRNPSDFTEHPVAGRISVYRPRLLSLIRANRLELLEVSEARGS